MNIDTAKIIIAVYDFICKMGLENEIWNFIEKPVSARKYYEDLILFMGGKLGDECKNESKS